MTDDQQNTTAEVPLASWKEIAAYLNRDARTVKRWEQMEGLPVHRHLHRMRSTVYAYRTELDEWRRARRPVDPRGANGGHAPRRVAIAAALIMMLAAGGDGPAVGGANAAAQSEELTARRVWTGADVDFMGRVSRDGRYISFVDWRTGDLAVREVATGETTRVTTKGSWSKSAEVAQFSAFSPDAAQIVYGWADTNTQRIELRIATLPDGPSRVLLRDESIVDIGPIDWSPDGRSLVTVITRPDRTGELILISPIDGVIRLLKRVDPSAAAIFSPDSRQIAYTAPTRGEAADRNDVYVISTDAHRDSAVVTHPANDMAVGWSPDATRLLFVSDRTGTNGVWSVALRDGTPQGDPVLLKPDIGRVGDWGGITHSGTFYYGINRGVRDIYIATIEPSSGAVVESPAALEDRFVGGKYGAAWSPDGRQLAYISQRPQQLSAAGTILSIHDLASGTRRDVPLPLVNANHPVWQRDRRAVLVWGSEREGRRGVYRIDLGSGRLERITPRAGRDAPEPGAQIAPVLSPDESTVFYYVGVGQNRSRTIWAQNVRSGAAREVSPTPVSAFALSPDGRSLAVLPAGQPVPVPIADAGIQIIGISGAPTRTIAVAADPGRLGPLAWMRDGRSLLFVRGPQVEGFVTGSPQNEVWQADIETGSVRRLAIGLPAITRISVHPGGRQLAISAGLVEFEVWTLENLVRP